MLSSWSSVFYASTLGSNTLSWNWQLYWDQFLISLELFCSVLFFLFLFFFFLLLFSSTRSLIHSNLLFGEWKWENCNTEINNAWVQWERGVQICFIDNPVLSASEMSPKFHLQFFFFSFRSVKLRLWAKICRNWNEKRQQQKNVSMRESTLCACRSVFSIQTDGIIW